MIYTYNKKIEIFWNIFYIWYEFFELQTLIIISILKKNARNFMTCNKYISSSTKNINLDFNWNIRWQKGGVNEKDNSMVTGPRFRELNTCGCHNEWFIYCEKKSMLHFSNSKWTPWPYVSISFLLVNEKIRLHLDFVYHLCWIHYIPLTKSTFYFDIHYWCD